MQQCNLESLILRPSVERPISLFLELYLTQCDFCAVEFHLSELIGTASHPDMQKIRIIGFFFENRLHWQFEECLLLFTVYTCV
jgi:hypothetical protein